MAIKRITRDYEKIVAESQLVGVNISAEPIKKRRVLPDGSISEESDMFNWEAIIKGPQETPYANGLFHLSINIPSDYPYKPPYIRFITPIFHPNVNSQGTICLNILKDSWSPALTIGKLLLSISSLMAEPNPDDPLDATAALLLKSNKDEFNRRASAHTAKYAT